MNTLRRVIRRLILVISLSLLAFLYVGLQGGASVDSSWVASTASLGTATATLSDPSGKSNVRGQASFTETAKGLLIKATVSKAPPGLHGFHIHEKGSCQDNGNAAGGHFNPDKVKHGKLVTDGFANAHAGDLGNISIAPNGSGSIRQTIPGLTLTKGKYAIANHAIILHAKKDDFGQPTGNAGGRIGCGVIKTTKAS
jgi:Cu-Zn family superoxide dismutase